MNTIFTPLITANLLRHRRVLVNQRRRSILVIKIMMMVISLLSSACQEKVTSSEALVPSLLPFTATLDEDISIEYLEYVMELYPKKNVGIIWDACKAH